MWLTEGGVSLTDRWVTICTAALVPHTPLWPYLDKLGVRGSHTAKMAWVDVHLYLQSNCQTVRWWSHCTLWLCGQIYDNVNIDLWATEWRWMCRLLSLVSCCPRGTERIINWTKANLNFSAGRYVHTYTHRQTRRSPWSLAARQTSVWTCLPETEWNCPDTCNHTVDTQHHHNQQLEEDDRRRRQSDSSTLYFLKPQFLWLPTFQMVLHDPPPTATDVNTRRRAEEPAGYTTQI